ncbi:MAG: hypothetical protein ABIP51_16800 [Bacteroidia bacterium]
MFLDILAEELEIIYEEVQTILGGFDVDVDITKEEVMIVLRNSLLKFEKETSIWQLQNQFLNVYGMPAGAILTNQLATINFNLVHQVTDWFASMNRVGGKIPWHKDYVTLEPGRQVYFLDKESSKPYAPGTRRIHRVMWCAQPEIFNSGFLKGSQNSDDVLGSNQWNFTSNGLNYGDNRLGFLGYTFDSVLMMQSMETRNKIMFSEFFHNLAGDVLEITPMPGRQTASIQPGMRVFYYYWEESEIAAGTKLINETLDQTSFASIEEYEANNPNSLPGLSGLPPGQGALIANPIDLKIAAVPWSSLSPWAKAFVKDLTLAKCKYMQGSKWRVIRKTFSTGEMDYEIEFDYNSLISEAIEEEKNLIDSLKTDLKELAIHTLSENQKTVVENAVQINKRKGRKWYVG